MRRYGTITGILVGCILAATSRGQAFGEVRQPVGAIHVGLTADKNDVGPVIMVSLVADSGSVIQQGEVSIYASVTEGMAARGFTNVPVCLYDCALRVSVSSLR
jgi:hypothetical protein